MTLRFVLRRDHHVTGVSGTGDVADGVVWPDGSVTIRWRGDRPSTVQWDRIGDAIDVHGHNGATKVVWVDPEPEGTPIHAFALQPGDVVAYYAWNDGQPVRVQETVQGAQVLVRWQDLPAARPAVGIGVDPRMLLRLLGSRHDGERP